MSWNYRVIRYANNEGFGLHEVYYDESGKVEGWTEDPVITCSANESFEREFIRELKAMMKDIESAGPVIEEDELPEPTES